MKKSDLISGKHVVELEDGDLEDWDGIIESCIFCDNKTRYWHKITNKPICPTCAEIRKVDEIKKAAKEYTRFQLAQYGMMNAEEKMIEQWAGEILKNREELNRLYELEESKKLIEFFKNTVKLVETEVTLDQFNEMSAK